MAKRGSKGIAWDAKELRKLYWEDGLCCSQIAKIKGVRAQAVEYQMRKLGLPRRSKSKAVSLRLSQNPTPRGPDNPSFKHGLSRYGYRRYTVKRKEVSEHRSVAAEILGRPIGGLEEVHHCNGIRDDNRPENLWVFPSKSAHSIYHRRGEIHPETIFLKDHA